VGSYRIELKRSAAKEIEAISNQKVKRQIVERIGRLAAEPRPAGSRKLSGEEAYRIRQGIYRIIYTIEDEALVVFIVKVAHRREVYR
jgi:mRNA interferase RelE/StbE